MRRKTVYLPEDIYPMTMLSMIYPSSEYKIIITKDGKRPSTSNKTKKAKRKR